MKVMFCITRPDLRIFDMLAADEKFEIYTA